MSNSKYIYEWTKNNKYRPSITFPKEWETAIKAMAKHKNMSINEYINSLVEKDIKDHFSGGGDFK